VRILHFGKKRRGADAIKAVNFLLCRMGGRGRAVPVAARRTFRATRRLSGRNASPSLCMVMTYHVNGAKAPDRRLVYFFDENGGQVEMA